MIYLHHPLKCSMADFADEPSSGARHLSNSSAHTQSLEQTTDRRALATTFRGIGCRSVERLADVGVSEATHHMFAIN